MVFKMAHFRKSTGPRWVNDYALYKKYDTYFGDVVPLLCVNALGINITTLSDSHKDCLSKIIFSKSKTKLKAVFL